MKRILKYFIRCGLGPTFLAALAVILAACSSTPSTAPATSDPLSPQAPAASAPPSLRAPATTATSPNTTQTSPTPAPSLTQRLGISGTLSNINGNILTLTTQQGTATVNVSTNTNIQKTVNGSNSDLQVGQFLSATGTPDANWNLSVTSVTIMPQNQAVPAPEFPTVVADGVSLVL